MRFHSENYFHGENYFQTSEIVASGIRFVNGVRSAFHPVPLDDLVANTRVLRAFPRRGHSRMLAGKREPCALRIRRRFGLWDSGAAGRFRQ